MAVGMKSTRLWKMCGDNMRFSNHSDEPNLLSAGGAFGDDIAAFDLAPGAELTVNYRVICDRVRQTGKL